MDTKKILQDLDDQFAALEALGLEPGIVVCNKALYDDLMKSIGFKYDSVSSKNPRIKKAQFIMDILVSDHLPGINVYAKPSDKPKDNIGKKFKANVKTQLFTEDYGGDAYEQLWEWIAKDKFTVIDIKVVPGFAGGGKYSPTAYLLIYKDN